MPRIAAFSIVLTSNIRFLPVWSFERRPVRTSVGGW